VALGLGEERQQHLGVERGVLRGERVEQSAGQSIKERAVQTSTRLRPPGVV
jgi:hypothetical protein